MPTAIQQAFAKATLLACTGYDPLFVDSKIQIDTAGMLPKSLKSYLPPVEGNKKGILHYSHLSVMYNADRKLPFFSAYNIDGARKASKVARASGFRMDPRLDEKYQLNDSFYELRTDITEFEIGHMAANNEMAWGKDAQVKSWQTFHFPNSVPQAERLNSGIWRSLESYITAEAASQKSKKISVFTGPVLNSKDPSYKADPSFRLPLMFFKVVVFKHSKGIFATGFLMSHEKKLKEDNLLLKPETIGVTLDDVEGAFGDYRYREVFQVNLETIEGLTGLKFSWKDVKRIAVPGDKLRVAKIRKVSSAADAEKEGLLGFSKVVAPGKNIQRLNMILP